MTHRFTAGTLAGLVLAMLAGTAAAQGASAPTSPAKRELVARILRLQQPDFEAVAHSLVERPLGQMLQQVGALIQNQVPPDKREAVAKQVDVEVKKYIDEAYPLIRDRAVKIAPATIGAALEARMSEDELKTLIAWLESPANKKFLQVAGEARNGFVQQVLREGGPLIDPKLQALDGRIRVVLGLPPAGAGPGPGPAQPPARPASK